MSPLDVGDPYPSRIAEHHLVTLKSQTSKVLNDAIALLENGGVEDPIDQKIVLDAIELIKNPPEDLEEIKTHGTNIGAVVAGYYEQGNEPPPAIDAIHKYFWSLECINRLNFVEEKLEQGSEIMEEIELAMAIALKCATTLADGYKDDSLLKAVNELRAIVESL